MKCNRLVLILFFLLPAILTSCKYDKSKDWGAYQVIKLDYDEKDQSLNRIFVVTHKDSVRSTAFIKNIACAIGSNYTVDSSTALSFFSEKKYAAYKTELFFDPGHTLPDTLEGKWLDSFYFGEFVYGSRRYTTFPSCTDPDRRQTVILEKCL